MKRNFRLTAIAGFAILLIVAMSGCGVLTRKPATQAPPEAYTKAAETIVVQLTQAAAATAPAETAPAEAAPQMPEPTMAPPTPRAADPRPY